VKNFAYQRPGSTADALSAFQHVPTEYIAGGTELLNWMRLGITHPDQLIDIAAALPKDPIRAEGNYLLVPALATLNEVGENTLVREHATVLSQACLQAASAQIRNRATIGGNVLQKTRCPYFRAESPVPWPCNKRQPGSGCAALEGLNERHAIFGWTDSCVAVHPSDPLVALACVDAEALVEGPAGRRTIGMSQFHYSQAEARQDFSKSGAAHEALLESKLRAGEIITGYRIPIGTKERSAYVKIRERSSYEYALVSAAVSINLEQSVFKHVRIALGSVAQRPWRLTRAEQRLVGLPLKKEVIVPIIRDAMSDAKPLTHNGYKITMAANAAARAIELAGAAT
jgi:xanthine dehydrogenase YagS FAD-binding subunit